MRIFEKSYGSMKIHELKRTAWTSVNANSDFIAVQTFSGYRRSRLDPEGARLVLRPDADNQTLGAAVLSSLEASRFVLAGPREGEWIHPEASFDQTMFDPMSAKNTYDEWVGRLMQKFGYKTKRALFKDMLNCNIEQSGGSIKISPTIHEKLEGWSGMPGDQDVMLADSSEAKKVGEGVRLAMSRCR